MDRKEFAKIAKIKAQKGITLLVLVVTIIVLLILAGITISAITGNNGIIKNAGQAKEETEIANEKEIVEKATVQAMGNNKYGNIVEDELQSELDKETGEGKTKTTDIGDEFEVLFTESNRYYTVDKDGNVSEYQSIIKDKSPGDITKDENGNTLKGDEAEPYEIWCIEDLVEWSKNYNRYVNAYIKLCTNLNFKSELSYTNSETKDYGDVNQDGSTDTLIKELQSGEGFEPIQQFSGNFDGNENIISNLYISKQDNAGLILSLNNADFKNITIKGEIYSESNDAGIVSQGGNSQIENVISDVTIYGGVAAGMIGKCTGKLNIKDCVNLGNVESMSAVGGICGDQFLGEMLNCVNEGTIKSSARSNYGVGGLCGNTRSSNTESTKIKNCINSGMIIYDGNRSSWYFGGAGGMIGLNRQTLIIQNCVNTGEIQSTSYAGAICGMDFTYWQSQETYELTNSFMLNNVEKVTGSNDVETEITVFNMEELENVVTSLNQYINNNKLTEQDWNLWRIENDNKLTLE